MDGIKARHAACLSTYLIIAIGALSSPTEAKDGDAPAPWGEEACNDVCKWWMKIGQKPAAEVPADPQPKSPAQALFPPAMNILPPSAAKVTIDPFRSATREPRKVKVIGTRMISPAIDEAKEPRAWPMSRWGIPIQGGVPVLAASFVPVR